MIVDVTELSLALIRARNAFTMLIWECFLEAFYLMIENAVGMVYLEWNYVFK